MQRQEPRGPLAIGEISLRRVVLDDAPGLAKLADDARIACWMRDTFPSPYSMSNALFFIKKIAVLDENFAICLDGELVGMAGGMFNRDIYRATVEVGYWVGVPYWGRGAGSKALALLCQHLIATQPTLMRLEACPFSGNEGSARVLEKNGFVREATLPSRIIKAGRMLDEWRYAKVVR